MASDNPHFFKVVLAKPLKEQKLEIPTKFVRKYGLPAFLNDQTCLKVADGREWNVGLTKSNGRVWFHHGWQKFVEFYSIKFEYFLVFKYEKKSSSFHVVIFDLTATEIKYPIKIIHLDEVNEEVKMETELDDFDLGLCPQDFKVGIDSLGGKRKAVSTASQRASAMAKATSFQSRTLNPSFMCTMWPSHIHPGKAIHVPRNFTDMHLRESKLIVLEVSEGRRSWVVCCGLYRPHGRKNQRDVELRKGWREFVRDNNLQVGDACVFEMVRKNSRTIAFEVRFFRASSSSK